MTPVRLALTADLHLGRSLSALPQHPADLVRQAQLDALAEICQTCREEQVDLLCIAGDLFDGVSPDPALLASVQQSFYLCPDTPVYIAPGNHDPYFPDGFWDSPNWPDHVHIVKTKNFIRVLPKLDLTLYSGAFTNQSQAQSLLDFISPVRDQKMLNLLLIHGDLVSSGSTSRYNPLPPDQLRDQGYDLILLGHRHDRTELMSFGPNCYGLYPGIPQATGFDEPGVKGFLIGHIHKEQGRVDCRLNFHPLSGPRFYGENVSLSPQPDLDRAQFQENVLAMLKDLIQQRSYRSSGDVVRFRLTGTSSYPADRRYLMRACQSELLAIFIDDQSRRPPRFDQVLPGSYQAYLMDLYRQVQHALSGERSTPSAGTIRYPETTYRQLLDQLQEASVQNPTEILEKAVWQILDSVERKS